MDLVTTESWHVGVISFHVRLIMFHYRVMLVKSIHQDYRKSVILEKWFKQSFLALCFHFLLTRKKSSYDEAFDVFSVRLMHRQAIEEHGLF